MFHKILVPLDFTAENQAALRLAREMAVRDGAQILLLHVIETLQDVSFEKCGISTSGWSGGPAPSSPRPPLPSTNLEPSTRTSSTAGGRRRSSPMPPSTAPT